MRKLGTWMAAGFLGALLAFFPGQTPADNAPAAETTPTGNETTADATDLSSSVPAGVDIQKIQQDLAEIAKWPDRSADPPGAAQAADYLEKRLHEETAMPVWRQDFVEVVPVVDQCDAAAEGFDHIALAPLTPSGGQAAALPGNSLTAGLSYLGKGQTFEMDGKPIARQFVAMEMDSNIAWQTAASLGARGIIFLGDANAGTANLLKFQEKLTEMPIGIPRFYCDDAAVVAAIRARRIGKLTVHVHVSWVEKPLVNLLCYFPAKQSSSDAVLFKDSDVPDNWKKQAVILQARYDASSQVIGRAPGAEQGLSAALLLDIAGRINACPDHPPIILALTAGDEWNLQGTRRLIDLLSAKPDDFKATLKDAADTAQKTTEISESINRLPADKNFGTLSADASSALQDQLLRQATIIDDKLQLTRLDETSTAEQIKALSDEKSALSDANAALLDKNSPQLFSAQILAAAAALQPGWQRERERRQNALNNLRGWKSIIDNLDGITPLACLELQITTHGKQFGFFSRSNFLTQDYNGRMLIFQNRIRNQYYLPAQDYLKNHAAPYFGQFNPETMNDKTLESFWPLRLGLAVDAWLWHGIPAGAIVTTQDAAGWIDTPNDSAERINWSNAARQINDMRWFLLGSPDHAIKGPLVDPLFRARTELTDNTESETVTLLERTVGATSGIGAPEYLVGAEMDREAPQVTGIRHFDWTISSVNGEAQFTNIAKSMGGGSPIYRLQAFKFGPDGLPIRAINQASVGQVGLVDSFSPDHAHPARAMVFNCRRLDLFGLFDPRYMDFLDKLQLMDAHKQAVPEFVSIYARSGMGAVFMEPALKWMLLVSKGQVSNRMVLINASKEYPLGAGFSTVDLAEIGPLSWRTARDLHALNEERRGNLKRFGISNDLINELESRSSEYFSDGQAAETQMHYGEWLGDAAAAWSLQSQVYSGLISASNDLVHGVIFLLLGVIPFSYFLERLMIGASSVYRQIGGFAAIFAVMTALLWSFHPAFRISSQPLMILLAFLILILSSTVINIMFGKFEQEIARLRGASIGAHSASLKRGTVVGAALRLGLSNMRRRGTRTALTLITLILLTFTLLCFTSVRETLNLTPQPWAGAPPYPKPEILFRMRSYLPLSAQALAAIERIAGRNPSYENEAISKRPPDETKAKPVVATRYWYASTDSNSSWIIPILPAGKTEPLKPEDIPKVSGLLGLDGTEGTFQQDSMESVLGDGWKDLANGQDVIFLANDPRNASPYKIGDVVDLLGHRLTVAGFFNRDADLHLVQIDGSPIFPLDPTNPNGGGAPVNSDNPEGNALIPEATPNFLKPLQVAIVPSHVVRELGGRLSSVAVRPADPQILDPETKNQELLDLARRSAFWIWTTSGQPDSTGKTQVFLYNAAAGSNFNDWSSVLIPIVIAGVIVLNTMLGAVAERTREIHVYTSLGLAPAHVGALFVAEAAALGTLGVVFGYIAGQGMATLLTHFQIMKGVELNYSSMSAVYTMGIVLGLVLLSTLWPARTASRVAAPSLERDWKLPRPVGDILTVDLPFTVNAVAARGVCAFLEEFFSTITQTGTGRFTSDAMRAFSSNGIRGITCRVWLAPYDLGVIQHFWLAVHPTKERNVYEVKLTLQREAGSPSTWHRLNRPFLVEVRKQFLLWRAVTPELVAQYVRSSEAMFAAARNVLPPNLSPSVSAA